MSAITMCVLVKKIHCDKSSEAMTSSFVASSSKQHPAAAAAAIVFVFFLAWMENEKCRSSTMKSSYHCPNGYTHTLCVIHTHTHECTFENMAIAFAQYLNKIQLDCGTSHSTHSTHWLIIINEFFHFVDACITRSRSIASDSGEIAQKQGIEFKLDQFCMNLCWTNSSVYNCSDEGNPLLYRRTHIPNEYNFSFVRVAHSILSVNRLKSNQTNSKLENYIYLHGTAATLNLVWDLRAVNAICFKFLIESVIHPEIE